MVDKTVNVKVTSEGLKETTAQAQKLNNELDKVEKPRKVRTTGSRAADAALSSSEGPISTGLGRGTAASMSRGDSRDFARQAQGLGGLVHVYATFAANIFAVAAAFNALSKAMDFELMVKSAETLSARLGTSVTGISRQIQVLTDGAVSLKDAMQSAALATSAGLTTSQIQGLTKAAKGASLAMGRDMTDSLNRVFRGTIKIEPELLDELGIMVKVRDVNADYAKSIGKTVASLTDFERRQAFVNGVLDQSKEKYGDLAEAGVNAYSKLQSSAFNLLTTIGGGLNTVLKPFMEVLSSSPSSLFLLLTSLVGLLVKQAIPAINDMSKQTLANLDADRQAYTAQKALFQDKIALLREEAQEKARVAGATDIKAIEAVGSSLGKTSEIGKSISRLTEGTAEQAKASLTKIEKQLEKTIKATNTRITNLEAAKKSLEASTAAGTATEKEATALAKVNKELESKLALQGRLSTAQAALPNVRDSVSRIHSDVEGSKEAAALEKSIKQAEKADARFYASSQRHNAVLISETAGLRAGWAHLKEEITKTDEAGNKVGTGKFLSGIEKAKGAVGLLTAGMARAVSAFAVWGAAIALGATFVGGLLKALKLIDNSLAATEESLTSFDESLKAYDKTLTQLEKAKSLEDIFTFNVSKLKLQEEALNSMTNAIDEFTKAMSKTGWEGAFTRAWESFKNVFGAGAGDDIVDGLEEIYKRLDATKQKMVDSKISSLGITPEAGGGLFARKTGAKTLEQALKDIDKLLERGTDKSNEEAQKQLKNIQKIMESIKVPEEVIKSFDALKNAYKTVEDNAEDYVIGLTKVNKEFDSAINLESTIGNLSSLYTSQNDADFNRQLIDSLKTFANSTFQAYAGMEESARQNAIALYSQLDEISKSQTLSAKDKDLASKKLLDSAGGTSAVFSFLYTQTDRAARALMELGNTANRNAIAVANINKSLRVTSAVKSYTGVETPESVLQTIKFQDTLIYLQIAQLEVQKGMLKQSMDNAKENVWNDENLKKWIHRGTMPTEAGLKDIRLALIHQTGYARKQLEEASKSKDPSATIAATAASSELEGLRASITALSNYISSINSEQISLATTDSAIKVLKTQYSTKLERNLAVRSAEENLAEKQAELAQALDAIKLDMENFHTSFISSLTGVTSATEELDRAFNNVSKAFTEAKNKTAVLEARKEGLLAEKPKAEGADLTNFNEKLSQLTTELLTAKKKEELINLEYQRETGAIIRKTYEQIFNSFSASLNSINSMLAEQVDFAVNVTKDNPAAEKAGEAQLKILKELGSIIEKNFERERAPIEDVLATNKLNAEQELALKLKLLSIRTQEYSEKLANVNEILEAEKRNRSIRLKNAESNIALVVKDSEQFKQFMVDTGETFITKIQEGMLNLKPTVEQLAEGFTDAMNETVDLFTELFQKSELTWDTFIRGTRNIFSDMFKELASTAFKNAMGGGLIDLIKKYSKKNLGVDLRTDAEKSQDARDLALTDNTTKIELLTTQISALIKALNISPNPLDSIPADAGLLPNRKLLEGYESMVPYEEPVKKKEPVVETFGIENNKPDFSLLDGAQTKLTTVIYDTAANVKTLGTATKDMALVVEEAIARVRALGISAEEALDRAEAARGRVIEQNVIPQEGLPISQSDFAAPKDGLFLFTGALEDAAAQEQRNEDLLRNTAAATEEASTLVKASTIILDRYNSALKDAVVSQEETVSAFDRLQTAIDELIKKLYKVPSSVAQEEKSSVQDIIAPTKKYTPEESKEALIKATEPYIPGLPADGLTQEQWDAANLMKDAAYTQATSASTTAEQVAQSTLNTSKFGDVVSGFFNVEQMFSMAVNKLLSGLGGGGSGEFNLFDTILSVGAKSLIGGIGGLFTSSYTPFAGTATEGMSNFSTMSFDDIGAFSTKFAKGGIMTPYGALELQKYATGGIASSPQAAIFGEGSMNEAFVPLPDGKSIPVSLSNTMPAGDTNISIQVNIESNGKQDTKVQSDAGTKFSKQLASAVKATIQEELIKQQRPGGLLYR